jgi:hypothetical protein
VTSASSSISPSVEVSLAPASSATSSSSTPQATTSAVAQSQVAANAPAPTAVRDSSAQPLPFDISTVALQSRVTVNLGRRLAKPTEVKRGWW